MKKEEIKEKIKKDQLICAIMPYLKDKNIFLAGGYIRDLFLYDKISSDRDLVVFDLDTKTFAKNLADSLGGAFVELDTINEIYRVVFKENYFDIAKGLNNSVNEDVDRRDFTINSIFYDFQKEKFYDKNNGFNDLEKKIIRTNNIENLIDDPLRMLRGFRFQAQTGFKIDSNILNFIQKNAKKIEACAKERINQEILKMFEGDFLVNALDNMFEIGLLEIVFPFIKNIKKIPPNTHHHLDLVHHSIETVKNIRNNNPLLRLAAFYHDIGKPECWTIEEDTGRHRFIGHDEIGGELANKELALLKFSKKQIEYISKLVKNHIYPSSLMSAENVTDKALARFVRKIHPDVEDLIELARADRLSARGEAVSEEMINNNLDNLNTLLNYYNKIKKTLNEMPKLLNGKEIMEILNLEAGPRLGAVINELKEAQIAGEVKDKKDAIDFLKKYGN